jgi:hypothetical protein
MVKPVAGYRPLAYSSPEAVQTTGTVALTHLGYLHVKTVGGNLAAHVDAEMKTARTATGVKFTRWLKNSLPFLGPSRPVAGVRVRRPEQRAAMDRRCR